MKYLVEFNTLGKAYLDLAKDSVAGAATPEKWTELAKSSAALGFAIYADGVRESAVVAGKLGVPTSVISVEATETVLAAQKDLLDKIIA